jgi:hypothetical protein
MTLAELAERLDVHPNRIPQGRTHFLEGPSGVSGGASPTDEAPVAEVKTPHAKIGELTLGNDFQLWRPAKRVCRAQGDDRPRPWAAPRPSGEGARDQPGQPVLPAALGICPCGNPASGFGKTKASKQWGRPKSAQSAIQGNAPSWRRCIEEITS